MKKLILFSAILFISSNIFAQKLISGRVLLNKQFALGNITVTAKKSKAIVSTNNKGEYTISCEEKDVLYFEAKMFKKVKKSTKGKDSVNVSMKFTDKTFDKEKMVKQGFIRAKDIEFAAKSVEFRGVDYSMYLTIDDLISSKFPFVTKKGNSYMMRGLTSLGTGSTTGSSGGLEMTGNSSSGSGALLVVNKSIVFDISMIVPNQIKSIRILKSSEASRYGSKGLNGVIEIETK